MKYTTELIKQIITSKKAKEILNMISPVYGNDYVSLWLFQAIGNQLDKCNKWTEEYIEQTVPQTATWSLPYWESEYGLPVNPNLTIEQRRSKILEKQWSKKAMNPARLAAILSGLIGAEVKIKENTGKNKFTVLISSLPALVDETAVRKKTDTLKPAHLIYDIIYQNTVMSEMYVGGVVQRYKVIDLKEV